MIFGRLRRRKSEVFEWEVLQKPRFGINEYPMLKKIDFEAILERFGLQFWDQKALKIGPERQQKTDVILGTFF